MAAREACAWVIEEREMKEKLLKEKEEKELKEKLDVSSSRPPFASL